MPIFQNLLCWLLYSKSYSNYKKTAQNVFTLKRLLKFKFTYVRNYFKNSKLKKYYRPQLSKTIYQPNLQLVVQNEKLCWIRKKSNIIFNFVYRLAAAAVTNLFNELKTTDQLKYSELGNSFLLFKNASTNRNSF